MIFRVEQCTSVYRDRSAGQNVGAVAGAPLRICHDLCDSGWYELGREGLPCHVGGHVSRVTGRVMELCYVKICVCRTRSSRCLQSAQTLGIMISLSPGVGTVDTAVFCSSLCSREYSCQQRFANVYNVRRKPSSCCVS